MNEPRRVTLKPDWLGEAEALPWDWVTSKLDHCRDVWLITIRADGAPQARPVWNLWDEDMFLLSIGGGGLKRTESIEGARASIHLDSASEVVILEGHLTKLARGDEPGFRLDPERLERSLARWNAKYDKDWTPESYGFNVAFQPSTIMAWTENEARTSVGRSGKWLIER